VVNEKSDVTKLLRGVDRGVEPDSKLLQLRDKMIFVLQFVRSIVKIWINK
jgi:hypothetical protein